MSSPHSPKPSTSNAHRPPKLHIVGIGASAGGLEAITKLVAHLNPNIPCAYIVLQHLSPGYRSMMAEILGRETALTVKEAEQSDVPSAGVIYVVPPNANAIYKDGRISLVTAGPEVVPKPSINEFLISLAAEEGEHAIGIVLSGTGSDGVAGLRAIQAAGGCTFAQATETAKYEGMPRAAIEAGVVDYVLPPEAFAERLKQLLELPPLEAGSVHPPDLVETLLDQIREKLQYDFSGYKMGTLIRRIRRREVATGNPDLQSYVQWITAHPQELEFLARDILISVTAFFRDQEAFACLHRSIADICNRKVPGREIRVWVAGCASGEEAYSIAMLFAESLGERLPQYGVQIFSTDIDDEALNIARRGIYPAASMTEVPAELRNRYFHPVNKAFEAGKVLRDMIVFARHNLVSDPPFLRLELVSCRNVLIYFDTALQAKVLRTFHFGLAKEGCLFLGRSESVAQAEQLFVPLERRERLFHKNGDHDRLAEPMPANRLKPAFPRRENNADHMLAVMAKHFGVTAALCDADGDIQHTVGRVDLLFQFPVGATRMSITETVVSSLRGELFRLIHQCRQTGKAQHGRRRKHQEEWLRMFVKPVEEATGRKLLVLFTPEKPGMEDDHPLSPPGRELEDELLSTREHLQAMVEETATANEEMQSLNEEVQASNEELQAANEELEAANEELQATNQELVSLNEEMNAKTHELSRLWEEYSNLYDAIQFPIMVFDRVCQLIRFNMSAARRFDLRPTALRQHVGRLRLPEGLNDLESLLGSSLANGDKVEKSYLSEGRFLRLTVVPGLDKSGQIATIIATIIDVTDITRAQSALEESQARLNALMEHTTVIFSMKDIHGAYLYANQRFLDYFGVEDKAVEGKTDHMLLPAEIARQVWSDDLQALRDLKPIHAEYCFGPTSETRHLRTVHQVLLDAAGAPSAFIMEAEDVSAMRRAEEQLRITSGIFEHAGEAIAICDHEGMIENVNPAFTHITGYLFKESLGQNFTELIKSPRHNLDTYITMWQLLNLSGYWQGEVWSARKDGELYPLWLTINRIRDAEERVKHYVAVFTDISPLKDAMRNNEFLATHDPLTGLPNRTLFNDRLRHAISQARRDQSLIAVLFIDLDNFKTTNDTMGHDAGDELLQQVAERLKECLREMDTIARFGGDEFTAILRNCTAEVVSDVATRIAEDLSASFNVFDRMVFTSVSVGIAWYPEDATDATSLIKAADTAMYRAKERGRNRVEYFRPELHISLLKKSAIESGLREALSHGRLRLQYQPQYLLSDTGKTLVGAEALVRWSDPVLGEVPPCEFISLSESCGLIHDLQSYIITCLLDQIVTWHRRNLNCPPIAFNLSARGIQEVDFTDNLLAQIERCGIPSSLLQIEITESALMENSPAVSHNLGKLKDLGIGIAIDDFGTGYSSLSYLKRLLVTELKIDKTFVAGLGRDEEDEAIALAVLSLAKALKLTTVAEGVETERQVRWLSEHGCDIYQGYLLSKPLEADVFEELIARIGHDRQPEPR